MSSKLDLLESKIHTVIEELQALRKENERLKSERDTLKSQLALTSDDSRKATRFLGEYEQMKRSHDQVTQKVERALQKLNALRFH